MKINLSITQLILINQAIKRDREKNPFPEGHMDDSRNAAIDLTEKEIEAFDQYLQQAREKSKE